MERRGRACAMKFDTLPLNQGGMFATNGHSLYKSRGVIMDCLGKINVNDHYIITKAGILECKNTSRPLITIADVGAADGSTSLALFNEIIDQIRTTTGNSHQIMIYYTDLPSNDFNRLFNVIHDEAGLQHDPDVFCAAVGRSMFEQCLPVNSADLIFSSIAAMNLTKSPCRFKDGVSPVAASQKEMTAFKCQSVLDWKTFLIMRGRELRKVVSLSDKMDDSTVSPRGGYLVVLNLGTTKQGEVTVPIKGGYASLGHVLTTLLTDYLITKDEFLDCNVSFDQYRTEDDHALPFTENDTDLLDTGLELVSTRSFVNKLNHPSFEIFDKDDPTKEMYADRIIAGIKPWFYGTIYNGLSCSRSQQEREGLVDTYFARLWDFAYRNDDHIPQMALVEVVARKRVEGNE